jgi:transcriptional regulator with GAF, ATPase, and Fis domain
MTWSTGDCDSIQRKSSMPEPQSSGPAATQGPLPGVSKEQRLVRTFVELADALVTDFDLLDFLHLLAERTVDLLPAQEAALTLTDQRGNLRVLASTSEETRMLELFELQCAQGPGLDSFHTGEQVVNLDHDASRDRWPLFSAEASAAGFATMYALPLRLRGTVIGAINLFSADERSISDDDIAVGQALADVATIGLLAQFTPEEDQFIAENLQVAINTRIVIEQAKGVLSERLKIDMDQGLRLLRALARSHSTKLSAIAAGVIDGSIPAEQLVLGAEGQRALQTEDAASGS